MKILKIIGKILLALLVVFLLTGLFVKETNYSAEVTINKPIEEVFTKFNDGDLLLKWIPEIKSLDVIEEKEGKVGSKYKMVVESEGRTMEMIETITAFEPNKKVTFQFDADGMVKTDDYNFIADGNNTKVVQHCNVKGTSYLMKCMMPYMKGMQKGYSEMYMNRFKEIVEK